MKCFRKSNFLPNPITKSLFEPVTMNRMHLCGAMHMSSIAQDQGGATDTISKDTAILEPEMVACCYFSWLYSRSKRSTAIILLYVVTI